MNSDILGNKDDPHAWMTDVRSRFPDWNRPRALKRWKKDKHNFAIGQEIKREVVAIAPFGTWLDIGTCIPALLHFFNREDTDESPPRWNNGSEIGETVLCRIASLGDHSDISVTQRDSSPFDDNAESASQ